MWITQLRQSLCAMAALTTFANAQEGNPSPAVPPDVNRTVLAGHCVDGDGAPLAGAKVEVWRKDYREDRFDLVRAMIATTDGAFSITGLDPLGPEEWGFCYYLVVGRADGHAMSVATVRGEQVPTDDLKLVFSAPAVLRGEVLDERRRPVANALVHVLSMQNVRGAPDYATVWLADPLLPWAVKTDAEGRFVMNALPREAAGEVFVRHAAHRLERIAFTAGDELQVVLQPGGSIAGRVLAADGAPAAFVRVQCQGVSDSGWATARTDEQGRYRLESLQGDAYNVWAVEKDFTMKAVASLPVAVGEQVAAPDLKLVRGGFIVGRVVDAATGEGVQPGITADVGLYGPSRPRAGAAIEVARVAADGTFTIRAAPGDNYVYLRGTKDWPVVGPQSHNVVVTEGGRVEIKFEVRRRSGDADQGGR